MEQKDLEQFCCDTRKMVGETAEFIANELGKVRQSDIEVKALNSLVSYVDKTAEERLVEGLGKLIPGAVFLTEEETVSSQSGEYQWIIDPLDGTTNFLHQVPCFAVSVALRHRETTILGVVQEVNRKECFYAWREGGAFLNGEKIQVSPTRLLKNSLIATGFPYYDFDKLAPYLKVLEYFMLNTRGIRRMGAAAVDLAYVACGRFDTFFEYGLNAWDVAAGALIVQEAGGRVFDFNGGGNYLFGRELIASNPFLSEEVLKIVAL